MTEHATGVVTRVNNTLEEVPDAQGSVVPSTFRRQTTRIPPPASLSGMAFAIELVVTPQGVLRELSEIWAGHSRPGSSYGTAYSSLPQVQPQAASTEPSQGRDCACDEIGDATAEWRMYQTSSDSCSAAGGTMSLV
jgi:hypothetical protein